MAEWRERAVEGFPELHDQLVNESEVFSPYALWFELLPLTRDAHRVANEDVLRRVYGYAAWSDEQGGDLANAVAVSFYEHLFDERWMRPLVVLWVSQRVIDKVRPLWAGRPAPNELQEVEKLLRDTK